MVQCTPDLTEQQCNYCLVTVLARLSLCYFRKIGSEDHDAELPIPAQDQHSIPRSCRRATSSATAGNKCATSTTGWKEQFDEGFDHCNRHKCFCDTCYRHYHTPLVHEMSFTV